MQFSALETLAIIAYKQPITKSEIEEIRGVSCDYTVQKLMEKDLVAVAGRADGPGKPLLYKTSTTFMDHFGINSTKDLPKLKEIETQHRMDSLRDMDPGFVWLTLKWARGQSIARVLKTSDLQAGDFVRWSKQVIDLLGQISLASEDPEVASAARASSDLINRGIVAW